MAKDEHILIVEDSPATTILLKDFLNNLGYKNIHSCGDGQLAIDTFKELVDAKRVPIVLLDFVLPDMDGRSIMTEMLHIYPNVKVILVTATEKSDSGVKELIRQGIYQYVEKPIRFDRMQQVFETLEKEKSFFDKESEQEKLIQEEIDKSFEQVDFLLQSYGQMSKNMIQEVGMIPKDLLEEHIQDLEKQNKIINIGDINEIACNQCNSVKTRQTFFCPSCQKTSFNKSRLIEHFECGNFSVESDYKDNTCPKCKKQLKAVGVDYRVIKDRYICNNCKNVFQEMASSFVCLKCNNKFTIDEGVWQTSPYYKAVNSAQ